MDFNCNVKIVDSMMGSGKSSAAINHINMSSDDAKFLIITPYLDEIERFKKKCPRNKFKSPIYGVGDGTKIASLKTLVSRGENIVSTHALFQKFDSELINICRTQNYTLILDEVANVIDSYYISKSDFDLVTKYFVTIDKKTKLLKWSDENKNYEGKFSEIKQLCDSSSLACYRGSVLMWLFPVDVFNAFQNVYILTYMFNAQLQKYYYDYHELPYTYLYVAGDDVDTYHFTEDKSTSNQSSDYLSLIHILDNKRMNQIGRHTSDLSKSWFEKNKGTDTMERLKNHLNNFFRHIRNDNSKDNLWTTFAEYRPLLQGRGYTRGFLPLNARATNDYCDRTSVAYIANRYMNPIIKNFFRSHGVTIDEDSYALAEMLQFIWRSAIRNGEDVYVYVPSIRMRSLLENWINTNGNTQG